MFKWAVQKNVWRYVKLGGGAVCPPPSFSACSVVVEVLGCHLTAVAYLGGGGCPPLVSNLRYATGGVRN